MEPLLKRLLRSLGGSEANFLEVCFGRIPSGNFHTKATSKKSGPPSGNFRPNPPELPRSPIRELFQSRGWLEDLIHLSSGTKKEHKPKLSSPDIFRWGRCLAHEGVGAKKFGMSLEIREIELSWRISRDFAGISRQCLKSLRKKSLCSFLFPNSTSFLQHKGARTLGYRWASTGVKKALSLGNSEKNLKRGSRGLSAAGRNSLKKSRKLQFSKFFAGFRLVFDSLSEI